MCSKKSITTTMKHYSNEIIQLKQALESAEAILVGAGAGLSTSAGHDYAGKRFLDHFADFHETYGISDIYSGGFYPFDTLEEYWAWWSRHIDLNRFKEQENSVHKTLLCLLQDKNYFVITTNVDHLFQSNGFDKKRLFYTQGDYGLWQCSKPCHKATYDNEKMVKRMVAVQQNMKIPSELIPMCPKCGVPMTMNLRSDHTFVQDEGWDKANANYVDFVQKHKAGKILFIDLGIGGNTPGIIKYPFWIMTSENPLATYACVNIGNTSVPSEIKDKSICIKDDIGSVLGAVNSTGSSIPSKL